MKACITIKGNDIFASVDQPERKEHRILISDKLIIQLKNWAQDYDHALWVRNPSILSAIGKDMFNLLDESGWASYWTQGIGARVLEVAVKDNSSAAMALLDLPWEIMANQKDFLAADNSQPYVIQRRIGQCNGNIPQEPDHADLMAMFMAAAPKGEHELNFEDEESAILTAQPLKRPTVPQNCWLPAVTALR